MMLYFVDLEMELPGLVFSGSGRRGLCLSSSPNFFCRAAIRAATDTVATPVLSIVMMALMYTLRDFEETSCYLILAKRAKGESV